MKLFDVMFLKIRNWYIRWNEKDIPGVYALGLVSLLQSFNILSLVFILHNLNIIKLITKPQAAIIPSAFLLINFLRYGGHTRYMRINEHYAHLLNDKKTGAGIWMYSITSIVIMAITTLFFRR